MLFRSGGQPGAASHSRHFRFSIADCRLNSGPGSGDQAIGNPQLEIGDDEL